MHRNYIQKNIITFTKKLCGEVLTKQAIVMSEVGKSGIKIDEYKDEVFKNDKNRWVITGFSKEIVKS